MDTRKRDLGNTCWPEALAGATVGGLLVLALAFTPWRNAIDLDSPTLLPLLLIGALIGAAVSWFAARPELERITGQRDTYVTERRRRAA
jgi:hypothetical protein